MQIRMWMYDLAREQTPTLDHLRRFCELSLSSGYNAFGLYMEHRFAYPSTPWSHGKAAVTPEMARTLIEEFSDLQIVPFVNLLGHFEGMLYTEQGRQFAEEKFKGMQACPSNPKVATLAQQILNDVLEIFPSSIVPIGGDETEQLGRCTRCQERIRELKADDPDADGKAILYGEYFAPLAEKVLAAGRSPAIWGDMFPAHPSALPLIPKGTIVFDWQYFKTPLFSAKRFIDAGHEVILCPTLHTYSASWAHLPQAEYNVREHVRAANELNAMGMCLTTWEGELMGNYETLLPAIKAIGALMTGDAEADLLPLPTTDPSPEEAIQSYRHLSQAPILERAYLKESETYEEWARLMGSELQCCGGMFAFGDIRSSLKCRLLLYSNPFLLWLHHADELCGEVGNRALEVLDRAIAFAPDSATRGVSEFVKIAIQFVRQAEESHLEYAQGKPGAAITALSPARSSFDDLARIAKATHLRIGGSLADVERCHAAKEHVEKVIRRIKQYGDGSLGYLPSFETITHPKFMPHDQGNWWLINSWANE